MIFHDLSKRVLNFFILKNLNNLINENIINAFLCKKLRSFHISEILKITVHF